jgi:predicted PurR-regulated permease PerM
MDNLRDYVPVLPSMAAVVSTFLAVLVANFFKRRPCMRVALVVITGLFAVAAVGVTVYGQHQIIAQRAAQAKRNAEIRQRLGDFIREGATLVAKCPDANGVSEPAIDAWLKEVNDFLDTQLGHSYSERLLNPIGSLLNVGCNGANQQNNTLFRIVMGVNGHLEQFSQQPDF